MKPPISKWVVILIVILIAAITLLEIAANQQRINNQIMYGEFNGLY